MAKKGGASSAALTWPSRWPCQLLSWRSPSSPSSISSSGRRSRSGAPRAMGRRGIRSTRRSDRVPGVGAARVRRAGVGRAPGRRGRLSSVACSGSRVCLEAIRRVAGRVDAPGPARLRGAPGPAGSRPDRRPHLRPGSADDRGRHEGPRCGDGRWTSSIWTISCGVKQQDAVHGAVTTHVAASTVRSSAPYAEGWAILSMVPDGSATYAAASSQWVDGRCRFWGPSHGDASHARPASPRCVHRR
jgi:hypothetical protein